MPISKESFDRINADFKSAEKSIKDCEILMNELPQGAVNELRYAASHLVEYLVNEDDEHLKKFQRHCRRAKYDSKEIPVLMKKEKIDILLERFQGNEDIVSDVIGEGYSKILKSRRETNKAISDANNSSDSREDYLDAINGCLEVLKQNLATLEDATPAIERKIKRAKPNNFWVIVGVIVAIVFGILGMVLTIYFNKK